MASRFATVLIDKILAVNQAAALADTRKRQDLACQCLLVSGRKFSC